MISLLFPFVLLAGVVLALAACALGRWKAAAVLLVMALALDIYAQCVPLRVWRRSMPAAPGEFSVLAFNVHGAGEAYAPNEQRIAAMVLEQDADFILLTEYFQKNCSDTLHNRIVAAGYDCVARVWSSGNALYSRTGAKQTMLKLTPSSTGNVNAIEASVGGKALNVYFCHLSSNNYDSSRRNYSTPADIKDLEGLKFYLGRIDGASKVRRQEVEHLLERMEGADVPTVIIGDMNDVSGSPALNDLRRHGFKDAWWKGGVGYGATIHDPLPFRIDHILYNDALRLRGIKKLDTEGMSDHDALVARFGTIRE